MKKLLTVFVAVILLMVCAVSVNAAETGTCGDNLTWTLDGNRLVISGTGPMYDYSAENPAPWSGKRLLYIEIGEGVTSIGVYAFAEMNSSPKIYIASSVKSIGSKAFSVTNRDAGAVYFLGKVPTIAEDSFANRRSVAYYLFEEEETVLRGYGGELKWTKGSIFLSDTCKMLYGLNEEVKPEDFLVGVRFNSMETQQYLPKEVIIGHYDNSTCGQKTIAVSVDGYTLDHIYYVTDGQSHLDLIEVSFPAYIYYNPVTFAAEPSVTAGALSLERGRHYSVEYKDDREAGTYVKATVRGKGIYEGYEETFTYAVLKKDISDAYIFVANVAFQGLPVMPDVTVRIDDRKLTAGSDYVVYYENNVNVGTATVHIVGQGNYCGSITKTFEITQSGPTVTLKGNYIGKTTGTLSGDSYYGEVIVPPGNFVGQLDASYYHVAYYELYRIEGEEAQLITTRETSYGPAYQTQFEYDFSSVYEGDAEAGGAIYVLSYLWADAMENVYSGACVMIIPAKVPDATSMVVEQVEGAGDFRRAYVTAYGPDGNVGTVEWTTSDPSVATVNSDGVVSFKKPGSVTVTGKYGSLTDSVVVTAQAQDIRLGDILSYESQTEKAKVIFDGFLLTAGTDYTVAAEERDGVVTVTVTGCGLFSGQLVREFDVASGEALDHTHSFDNSCDGTCNGCDFTRSNDHDFAEAWSKNGTQHWHACTVCGEKTAVEDHTLSSGDNTVCTVCGSLYTPGDLDNNGFVDNKDVEYLLWYTLFSEDYPLNQDADFDGNGQVDNKDVEYLLWHTLFSEDYPLVR